MRSDRRKSTILVDRRQLLVRAVDTCPVNINPLTDWWESLAPLTRQERVSARQAAAAKARDDSKIQQHRSIIGKSGR